MERQAKDGTIYKQVAQDEWEPVTRKAKDGTTYKKVGKDEWAPMESTPKDYIEAQKKSNERPWYAFDIRNVPAGVATALEKIDSVTGAPIREFVTEQITGQEFSKAPTGAEQAQMLGATDKTYKEMWGVPSYLGGDVSPADIYGTALEVVQDPLVVGSWGKKLLSEGAEKIAKSTARKSTEAIADQSAKAAAEGAAKSGVSLKTGDLSVEQGGKLFEYKAPQSLDELRQWKPKGKSGELLGMERLRQIEQTVPDLEVKPLKYHYSMMENPKAMKELKLQFENLPTEDAKKIAAYNQSIVDESASKLRQTVNDIGGGFEPRPLGDAGDDFISVVKDKYNAEKDALAPAFEKLSKTRAKLSPDESRGLIIGIGENSKIGKLITQNEETGRLALKKNTPRSGISDSEHSVLSRVIDDMNDGMSFKEIQDTRDFLRKQIDPTNPSATSEIGKVRSILLGQMEELAAKSGPDVGETFKRYAINERQREAIEKIIGGKVESIDTLYNANPDRVVKKVFSNPNHADIVREYVGPEKFQEMVASYIDSGLGKAFDQARGFNPSTARNWINKNRSFLEKYAGPEVQSRLSALADYGYYGKRFLDEVNPSGTAASLKEMLEPKSLFQRVKQEGAIGAAISEVATRAGSFTNQRSAVKNVDEMLGAPRKQGFASSAREKLSRIDKGKAVDNAADAQVGGAAARGIMYEDQAVRASAEKEQEPPKRGPLKWANDGLKKLEQHTKKSGETSSLNPELLKDPKAKKLLIEASSLTPGTKRMDSVLSRLARLERGR